MKINFKKYLLLVAGILAGIILIVLGKPYFTDKSEKIILNIEGKEYVLYTARTTLEHTRGLSGITELKGADGMIFYFEPAQRVTFWNKNTHLNLELIWLRNGKVIGRDFLPSEDSAGLVTKAPLEEVDQVVELVK